MEQPSPSSNVKKLLIAAGAILVVGILLQKYFKRTAGSEASAPREKSVERVTVKADTGDWEAYTNEKLGFMVQYPKGTTLRGTAESDLAILMLDRNATVNKQAMVTLTKKKVPLGREAYKSMDEFWEDEQRFIAANSGVVSGARTVEVNERPFWEAREDNRQNNYMGLHRYFKQSDAIYEGALTIEGEKLEAAAVELYNKILTTLTVR